MVGEAIYSDIINDTDPCAIIITRTWSLTDDCGNNAADQVQIITIEDSSIPSFTAPIDITIYKDENCNYDAGVAFTGDVINEADNCEVGEAIYSDAINDTDPCHIIITRTWSLSDDCGNAAADQVQIITIEDSSIPSFTAPVDITIYKDENCIYDAGIAFTGDVINEADNCMVGEAIYSDIVNDTDPCHIIITRTWSLTDDCGNAAADQVQIITIEDNTIPTFTAPINITIYKDEDCIYDAGIAFTGDVINEADNCNVGEAIYSDIVNDTDPCAIIITRTWSLTDACGNDAADQVQIITIEDNTIPTFTAPINITIYKDENCNYDAGIAFTGDVINEVDNCHVGEALYSDIVNDTDPCAIIITRTWSLSDDCENAAADQVQIITIEDNTIPTFTAPINITIYKDEDCNYDAGVLYTGDVTDEADNCHVGEALYSDIVNDTDPCAIIITRTWSLTDDCGNAAADQVQIITIEDSSIPTFTAPIDITIYKDEDCNYDAGIAFTGDVINEADNCHVGEAIYSDIVDDTDPCLITITRTWSLTDDCGNAAADQIQVISVDDNTDPIAVCQDMSIDLDPVTGLASIMATDIDNGSSDNCAFTLSINQTDFDCSHVGDNIVTLTVSDDCGNTAVCEATVTVNDITAPLILCPSDQDLFIGAGCEVSLPDYETQLTATDVCGIASIVQIPTAGTLYTGADAGVHTIEFRVTDVNNNVSICTFDITIIDAEAFTITDVISTNVICNGDNNGTITVITTGGPSGLFYSIDGIDYTNATGIFTDLAPNTYTVSVMNGNDCLSTWTADIEITEPTLLVIDEVFILDVLGCYGDHTGEIEISASGGSPSYLYTIDNGNNWQTSNVFSNLPAGNYNVFVKDAHDCITPWGSIEITQPTQVILLNIDIVHITECYGDLTGEIHIDANGGTGILSYSVDGGNTWSQNNGDFIGLAAGYYFIQFMDENGCTYTLGNPVTVHQPAMLIVNDIAITNVTECYGNTDGALDISASGGTGTILYSIDGGATFVDNGGLFNSLAGGEYHVFISDDNGCSGEYADNPVIITQPLQIIMDVNSENVSECAGNNDGFISISATGGTSVYTYSIDGGASWSSNPVFTNLIAGSYMVMCKDDLSCTQPYAGNPVIIDEPAAIVYNDVSSSNLSCYASGDGEIAITATGGTGVLSYSIDAGTTYQTDPNFFGLDAGSYYLMVLDDNACDIAYGNNPVVLSEGNEIIISDVITTDVSCDGSLGSIIISATGGTGSLHYSIDNGNHYQVSNIFNNLESDTYIVKVKDGMGCTQLYDGNPIVVEDLTASNVVINANPGTEVCTGTNVTLSANAYEAVSYTWNTGETGASIIVTETTAGTVDYTCTVLNEDGCESSSTISITYNSLGSDITITADPGQVVLVGQNVTLEAYAPDAISYEWQPSGSNNPIFVVTSEEVQTIEFVVTVINSIGCESSESIEIEWRPVGLSELEFEMMTVNVYPNPNNGEFSLELTGVNKEVNISVIDFAGRHIYKEKILDITDNKIERQYNFNHYERGVYFLRITHGDSVSYKKVVVQ